ncbi:MAG: glycosyltransferase [Thermodesulfobacteriota bacterium]|nr:MAG: glycosyltransferase [Thermodesulfobacteriota bacterium]
MKLVVFGLTMSSSWGNGHATIWRGLAKALNGRGHKVVFFEKDAPYYASHRDLDAPPWASLVIYKDWDGIRGRASEELKDSDVGMVTSYCPDGVEASGLLLSSGARIKCFYDLDTPVTLKGLKEGKRAGYLPVDGLGGFDIVLSYTGGRALKELKSLLGARRAEPLYGSVDPASHFPSSGVEEYRADLSYLGTFSEDRQAALIELFVKPARTAPGKRFVLGGSLYPESFPWTENMYFVRHVPPPMHPAFYSSAAWTLNVTRGAMAGLGWCPSGRLFEAAACGSPVLSDWWEGIDGFFAPGSEIAIVRSADDVREALSMTWAERKRISRRARERALAEHTSHERVAEFERLMEEALRGKGEACGG